MALFGSLGRSTARPGGHNVGSPRRAHSPLDHHRRRHRARAGGDAFARRFRRPAHRPGRGLPGVQRALPQLPLQVRSGRLRVRRAPRRGVRGRRVRPLVCTQRRRSRGRTSPSSPSPCDSPAGTAPPTASFDACSPPWRCAPSRSLRPAKYYGKWSFHRVLGMQEIISSLASVANAAVHVRYLPELLRVSLDRVRPSPARNRARLWLVNAVVNVNGWTWSAVFHARDTPRTHFMDYASANAIFFFALFAVLVRVWGRRGGRSALAPGGCVLSVVRRARPRDERARRRVEVSVRAQHAGDDGRRGRALVAAAVVGLPSRVGKEIVGAASGPARALRKLRVLARRRPVPRLPISRPWEAY